MEKLFSNPLTIVSFTPFNQYFIVDAFFRANYTELALSAIRKNWGGQLDLGATSFWETFSDQWLGLVKNSPQPSQVAHGPGVVPNGQNGYTSLCHPWSGGVAALLSKYVLGIRPQTPGFREWQVFPLLRSEPWWLMGEHPGGLVVEFDASLGHLNISNAPMGSVGSVGIANRQLRGGRWYRLRQVWLGSSLVWEPESTLLPLEVMEDHLMFHGVRGCESMCSFVALYGASVAPPLHQQINGIDYPIGFLGADRSTHGEWLGRYGTHGYLLFSFDGLGVDRSSLPAGLKVRVHRGGNAVANSTHSMSEAGVASLQDPTNSSAHALGSVHTSNPGACQQDFAIDIEGAALPPKISLYMADVGNFSRVQAIEVFDLSSKDTAGIWQRVNAFPAGAYFSWLVPKATSVRFRVVYMIADLGRDATVSAIFFDDVASGDLFVI